MSRFLALGYGAICYLAFLVAFLCAIAFVGGFWLPHTVDHGVAAPIGEALVVNMLLLGLFAVQHSVMARPAFKRWWTRFVPHPVERSTYVLLASLILLLLYWQWRTMPALVWQVGPPVARWALWALFWLGWAIVIAAVFQINQFDLFGLRQVWCYWRGEPYSAIGFRQPLLYRLVRHPLMLGFVIAFWATPTMTAGHLLFAIATTGYILIALQLEERDLQAALGDQYGQYRQEVSMIVPYPRRKYRSARKGPAVGDADHRGPQGRRRRGPENPVKSSGSGGGRDR